MASQFANKPKNTHANYRSALSRLALQELEGEDIDDAVAALASFARLDTASVRAEITEIQQDY